ncbi:MAG: hypothetical protein Q9211_000677 [Gyalolechia sp. 1 TL-2023]
MAEGEPRYPVTITFTSPGACPPVYVAGSFTSPQWQLHELEYSRTEHKDAASDARPNYVFCRTFDVQQGTFQYKFRLGYQGDWWVCDSNAETVTDAAGNQNNRLVVTPPSQDINKGTSPRRRNVPDDSSAASSGAPGIRSASPLPPARSIMHRIFIWFQSILIFLFPRKAD